MADVEIKEVLIKNQDRSSHQLIMRRATSKRRTKIRKPAENSRPYCTKTLYI